jgi:hypothetical protein
MRAAILILLGLSGAAHADVYKCSVDGHIVFSDKPCEGAASKKVDVAYHKPTESEAANAAQYRADLQKRSDPTGDRVAAQQVERQRQEDARRQELRRQAEEYANKRRQDDIQRALDRIAENTKRR